MFFRLFEQDGEYANKNLLNANVIKKDKELDARFYFSKDYKETFGNDLFDKFDGKPVVEINLVIDKVNLMSGLMTSEDDEIFDKENENYDKNSIFIPLSNDTPETYQYRLSAFYVLVKEQLNTVAEKHFFRGIGYSLLCWILSDFHGSNNILALEASGDGDQEDLVKYYKKLGFKTCSDISNVPKKWYESVSASDICMYSTLSNLKSVCTFNNLRTFISTKQNN